VYVRGGVGSLRNELGVAIATSMGSGGALRERELVGNEVYFAGEMATSGIS